MRPVYWWWYSSGRWIGPSWSYVHNGTLLNTIGDTHLMLQTPSLRWKSWRCKEQNHLLDEHEDKDSSPSQYEVYFDRRQLCPICCFNQEKSLNGLVCVASIYKQTNITPKKTLPEKHSTVTVTQAAFCLFELGDLLNWISTFCQHNFYRVFPENSSLSYLWAKDKFSYKGSTLNECTVFMKPSVCDQYCENIFVKHQCFAILDIRHGQDCLLVLMYRYNWSAVMPFKYLSWAQYFWEEEKYE